MIFLTVLKGSLDREKTKQKKGPELTGPFFLAIVLELWRVAKGDTKEQGYYRQGQDENVSKSFHRN